MLALIFCWPRKGDRQSQPHLVLIQQSRGIWTQDQKIPKPPPLQLSQHQACKFSSLSPNLRNTFMENMFLPPMMSRPLWSANYVSRSTGLSWRHHNTTRMLVEMCGPQWWLCWEINLHHGRLEIDVGISLCFIWIPLPVLEKNNRRHYFSTLPNSSQGSKGSTWEDEASVQTWWIVFPSHRYRTGFKPQNKMLLYSRFYNHMLL